MALLVFSDIVPSRVVVDIDAGPANELQVVPVRINALR
jgi:hypothetical protein